MIKVQHNIPKKVYVACSGGVDSMAALEFLSRQHEVTVLHYNHGTSHGYKAERFIRTFCEDRDLECIVEVNSKEIPVGESSENFWREQRYEFFSKYTHMPIITCHHLDDCVETWIWSCMHGHGKIIPYRRNHIIRPFRLNRKKAFEAWALKHSVDYIEDESNYDLKHTRNFIRHCMMEDVLRVNPGISKTILKKVLSENYEN